MVPSPSARTLRSRVPTDDGTPATPLGSASPPAPTARLFLERSSSVFVAASDLQMLLSPPQLQQSAPLDTSRVVDGHSLTCATQASETYPDDESKALSPSLRIALSARLGLLGLSLHDDCLGAHIGRAAVSGVVTTVAITPRMGLRDDTLVLADARLGAIEVFTGVVNTAAASVPASLSTLPAYSCLAAIDPSSTRDAAAAAVPGVVSMGDSDDPGATSWLPRASALRMRYRSAFAAPPLLQLCAAPLRLSFFPEPARRLAAYLSLLSAGFPGTRPDDGEENAHMAIVDAMPLEIDAVLLAGSTAVLPAVPGCGFAEVVLTAGALRYSSKAAFALTPSEPAHASDGGRTEPVRAARISVVRAALTSLALGTRDRAGVGGILVASLTGALCADVTAASAAASCTEHSPAPPPTDIRLALPGLAADFSGAQLIAICGALGAVLEYTAHTDGAGGIHSYAETAASAPVAEALPLVISATFVGSVLLCVRPAPHCSALEFSLRDGTHVSARLESGRAGFASIDGDFGDVGITELTQCSVGDSPLPTRLALLRPDPGAVGGNASGPPPPTSDHSTRHSCLSSTLLARGRDHHIALHFTSRAFPCAKVSLDVAVRDTLCAPTPSAVVALRTLIDLLQFQCAAAMRASPTLQQAAPTAASASFECRVSAAGLTLLLKPAGPPAQLSTTAPEVAAPPAPLSIRLGADAALSNTDAGVTTLTFAASVSAAILDQTSGLWPLDSDGGVQGRPVQCLERVEINTTARSNDGVCLHSVSVDAGLVAVSVSPTLLLSGAGAMHLVSSLTAAVTSVANQNTAAAVSSPPVPSPHSVTEGRYVLSLKGLSVVVADAAAASSVGYEINDAAPPLARARIGALCITVAESECGWAIHGGFDVTADVWASVSTGSGGTMAQHVWRPLFLRPWVYSASAIIKSHRADAMRVTAGAEVAAAVSLEVEAQTPLVVRLVDAHVQRLLAGVIAWWDVVCALPRVAHYSASALTQLYDTEERPASRAVAYTATLPYLRWNVDNTVTITLHVPLISAELMSAEISGCEGAHILRLVAVGIIARLSATEYTPSRGTGSDSHAVQATVVSFALGELHALNPTALQGDIVSDPTFGVLVTSTPSAGLTAVFARYGNSCDGGIALDDCGPGPRTAQPLETQALVSMRFVFVSQPCPGVMALAAGDANAGAASTFAQATFDALHVELNARALSRVVRYALVSTAFPLAGLRFARTANSTASAGPVTDTALLPLLPASTSLASRCIVSVGTFSMSINTDSAKRRARLASLVVAGVGLDTSSFFAEQAGATSAENWHYNITGHVASLRLRDLQAPVDGPGTCFADILAPLGESRTSDVATFTVDAFGPGCDVRAATAVSAVLQPLQVVLVASNLSGVADALASELGRLFFSSSARQITVAGHVPAALALGDHVTAHADVQGRPAAAMSPPSLVSLSVSLPRAQCIVPVSFDQADAVVVQLENAELCSRAILLRGTAAAEDATGLVAACTTTAHHPSSEPACSMLPLDVFALRVAHFRVGLRSSWPNSGGSPLALICQPDSNATSAQDSSEAAFVAEARSPSLVNGEWATAWAASGLYPPPGFRALHLRVPPLTMSLTAAQLRVLLHVANRNLTAASTPERAAAAKARCGLAVSHLSDVADWADAMAESSCCARCGRVFAGHLVVARACNVCGAAVCVACVGGLVYDGEAGAAREACSLCWDELGKGVVDHARPMLPPDATRVRRGVALSAATPQLHAPEEQRGHCHASFTARLALASAALTLFADPPPRNLQAQPRGPPLLRLVAAGISSAYVSGGALAGSTGDACWHVSTTVSTVVATSVTASAADHALILAPDMRAMRASAADGPSPVQIEVMLRSRVITVGDHAPLQPSLSCEVVLRHCDVHADLASLVPLEGFLDVWRPDDPASAPVDAGVASGALSCFAESSCRLRTPPGDTVLTLTLHAPRILFLEAPERAASRVLLLSCAGSVTRTVSVAPPQWGLLVAPATGDGANTVVRCRRQAHRASLDVALHRIEVFATHLVPTDSLPARHLSGFALAGERISLLSPVSGSTELVSHSTAVLSLGCDPALWARDFCGERDCSAAAVDPERALASTLRPPSTRIRCALGAVHAALGYSDGLLAARVLARTLSALASVQVARRDQAGPPQSTLPLATGDVGCAIPAAQRGNLTDVEVHMPRGVELGLAIVEAVDPLTLAQPLSAGLRASRGATGGADFDGEGPADPHPLLIIEAGPASASSPCSATYDLGEGVRAYAAPPLDVVSSLARPGDVLLAVNGISVAGLGLQATLRLLRDARSRDTPIRLRLRPMTLDAGLLCQGARVIVIDDARGTDTPRLMVQVRVSVWRRRDADGQIPVVFCNADGGVARRRSPWYAPSFAWCVIFMAFKRLRQRHPARRLHLLSQPPRRTVGAAGRAIRCRRMPFCHLQSLHCEYCRFKRSATA